MNVENYLIIVTSKGIAIIQCFWIIRGDNFIILMPK